MKRIKIFFLLLILIVCSCSHSDEPKNLSNIIVQELSKKEVANLIDSAIEYRATRNYVKALRFTEKVLAQPNLKINFPKHYHQAILGQADVFGNLYLIEQAEELYIEAYEFSKGIPEYGPKGKLAHNNLFKIYTDNGQFDKAVSVLKEALKFYSEEEEPFLRANVMNNLGMTYQAQNKLEMSLDNFQEAIKLLKSAEMTQNALYYSIRDNVGSVYSSMGDFKKAEKVFSLNYQELNGDFVGAKPRLRFQAGIALAELAVKESDFYKAIDLLNQVNSYLAFREVSYNSKLNYYQLLIVSLNEVGDRTDLIQAKSLLSDIQLKELTESNLRKKNDLQLVSQLEASNFNEQKKLATQYFENELMVKTRVWISLFLGVLLFGTLIAVLFYEKIMRKRSVNELKINLLEAESSKLAAEILNEKLLVSQAETQLKQKELDVERLSLTISRKQRWLNTLKQNSLQLKVRGPQYTQKNIDNLIQELDAEIHSDSKNFETIKNVSLVTKEFQEKLHNLHPELTRSEVQLCELLRTGLNNAQIATFKKINSKSVRMAKYRLKKKLDLSDMESVEIYLTNLLA